ncbi:MAG: DUF3016 domain-containing protein [Burkholderiales bacterium]|nr:DUF3016 domain-containing protein [Burkholderiales bacterium]
MFALPAHADGKIEVKYVDPVNFTDAGWGPVEREHNLKTLSDYFQTWAARLPGGETLKLDVLDVKLAGTVHHRAIGDIRVINGRANWPTMKLRYTLLDGDRVLKSKTVELADMGYLFGALPATSADGSLPYEKRMLDDWFSHHIAPRPQP